MITRIYINGFKSFQNFEMYFNPLTIIAGFNAAGKSNLFDALQFLSDLTKMTVAEAVQNQRGLPRELFTKYGKGEYAKQMDFQVDLLLPRNVKDAWGNEEQLDYTRFRYSLSIFREKSPFGETMRISREELRKINDKEDKWWKQLREEIKQAQKRKIPQIKLDFLKKVLRPKGGNELKFFIQTEEGKGVTISQDGNQGRKRIFSLEQTSYKTVLNGADNAKAFKHACAIREEIKKWRFWQLNPEYLRKPTKKDLLVGSEISPSGKNLAATLFRIQQNDPSVAKRISRTLTEFIPDFTDVESHDDEINKQYIIKIKDHRGEEFSSQILSEGTLRILALCIQAHDPQHRGLLCFEEPENGIHPSRIHCMIHLLRELSTDLGQEIADLYEYARGDIKKAIETLDKEPLMFKQVIINTHSPTVIAQIVNLSQNNIPKINTKLKEREDETIFLEEDVASYPYNARYEAQGGQGFYTKPSLWLAYRNTYLGNLEGKYRKINTTSLVPTNEKLQTTLDLKGRKDITAGDLSRLLKGDENDLNRAIKTIERQVVYDVQA